MLIKICGITRGEDAQVAVRHGATAIGFVLWPKSPRYVDVGTAASIVRALPADVEKVGLFVDQPVETIRDIAGQVGLTRIQLHGNETPDCGAALGHAVMKAFSLDHAGQIAAWPDETLILLDSIHPVTRGGTGTRIDWPQAATIARTRRVVLAGGLRAENVAEAVAIVRPFGVDVASGVERAPGVKDHEKVRQFIAEARRALQGAGDQARTWDQR